MKLASVRIESFRNFLDSTKFEIQPDVTCLVGKNESGKTSALHALWRLNPHVSAQFDSQRQYPKWLEKRDRKSGHLENVCPITATFTLADKEMDLLNQRFGVGVLLSQNVTICRGYDNSLTFDFDTNEQPAVAKLAAEVTNPNITAAIQEATSVDALRQAITQLQLAPPTPVAETPDSVAGAAFATAVNELQTAINDMCGEETLDDAIIEQVSSWLPQFFYFDEYNLLPGEVEVAPLRSALQTGDASQLLPPQQTAVALMKMAAASEAELASENYDVRANEMEAVANELTREVLQYWSQNSNLRLKIDIDKETVNQPNGQKAVATKLKLRVEDTRHFFTNSLDDRSMGFRWFVSFLAAFSAYADQSQPVIILLDEPGLSLHGRAQADLLKFINERLAQAHQVVYSTHSPFMVAPGQLEHVRIVEDRGPEVGANITSEVATTDADTLFPLQGALGYDLVQHLFISEHNLVVEGISDFTYLTVLSEHLKSLGRVGLDERWSVIPVGGIDKVPTFVALLGNHLDITVVVDVSAGGNQKLTEMAKRGYLKAKRVITPATATATDAADIEDLFDVTDYLGLINRVEGTSLTPSDLQGTDPVVRRVERALRHSFSHQRPADELLRNRDSILNTLSAQTLDRFEKLISQANGTLT